MKANILYECLYCGASVVGEEIEDTDISAALEKINLARAITHHCYAAISEKHPIYGVCRMVGLREIPEPEETA